jgi:hypothetical protein
MNNQTKIALYWLLMGICFLAHNTYALSGLFFGKNVAMPDATGEIPLYMHVFTSVINTGTLVMAFLAISVDGKKFQWFSLIWAALFLLLNIFHLAGDGFAADDFDLSQVVLLSFVLVINATLVITLWKTVRQGKS